MTRTGRSVLNYFRNFLSQYIFFSQWKDLLFFNKGKFFAVPYNKLNDESP